ncbi:putative phospholipid:diacylglycerol acyltransferase [Podospora fimiseda]|uniref:Phospholipid:diacylglycerol acyltransferase n=1 Tax=Podospora fimiseda TaxID=252190 RepID=A0AAN7BRF9_9PEZI|nr:putative phospholipid:diacylglycerol acyltransferase [Podospora fimiseda]
MATTLRRRKHGDETPSESSPVPTPRKTSPSRSHEKIKIVHHRPKKTKRSYVGVLILGTLIGLVAAGFFAKNDFKIDFDFPELGDLSMESLLEVIPAGFMKDIREMVAGERDHLESYDAFTVGDKASAEGLTAHHPMVIVPGVISTGLESWGTNNASRPYYRKRLWGSWTMMRALVMDKENWKRHIMLDKKTGLDPPGIRLQAAQGFDATDFFITGYWIWNKVVENLGPIGYDTRSAYTAAYDWRLAYPNLEKRDQYFTRLRAHIETAVEISKEKVVLTSHSMGSQVVFYFMHWVASPLGGNRGDDWVEKHIASWINVSGCMLGAAKDVAAILSGEMRDTAQLNAFAVYGLEKFLSKEERAEMFRRMPGISSMLPMGGNAIWGDLNGAPDDLPGQELSFGSFINFRSGQNWTIPEKNFTMDDAMTYLWNTTEEWYQEQVKKSYSQGIAHTTKEVNENEKDPRKWINPLETRLPLAPSLKIYCFYGVGKPTERAYYYRRPLMGPLSSLNLTIDTGLIQGEVDRGVILGEGDGTVNLMSTGYMCNKGWKMKRYNPAGVKITVVEMPHEPERFNPRGGPNTADHVDILGRQNLNEYILRIAAGKGDDIQDNIISNIKEYAEKAKVYEEGGGI